MIQFTDEGNCRQFMNTLNLDNTYKNYCNNKAIESKFKSTEGKISEGGLEISLHPSTGLIKGY
jgi:hypothetical protein